MAIEGREKILAQLEKVLASETFRTKKMLPLMLRYVVEETVAEQTVTENTIALAIYGKVLSEEASKVRVNMGEVREALRDYYEEEGRFDGVVIKLNKGGYVPTFKHRSPHP